MGKDLRTLVRLHAWTVDEKRRKLGALLRLGGDLEDQVQRLEEEVVREQGSAGDAPEVAGFYYGNYANAVIERRERLRDSIARTETEIAAAQEELREAYRDLKKYEVAQDMRERRETEERERVEQQVLDEVGLEVHRRRRSRRAG